MLHNHHGIALVPESLQGIDKFAVVPLVEAYGRFIKNIEDIDQFRTDLGGEPYALAFSSGKGRGGPVERKVFKTDIDHEIDPLAKFLEDVPGDCHLPGIQFPGQGGEPLLKVCHLHRRDIGDSLPVDSEALGVLVKTCSPADRTDHLVADIFHYPAEGNHLRLGSFADAEQVVASENDVRNRLIRHCVDRIEKGETVLPGDGADDVELLGLPDLAQGNDSSVGHRNAPVGDNGVQIDIHNHSQTLAVRAVALRRVERE